MTKTYQIVVSKPFKYQDGAEKLEYKPGELFPYDGSRAQVDMLQRGELAIKVVEAPVKAAPKRRAPRKKAGG